MSRLPAWPFRRGHVTGGRSRGPRRVPRGAVALGIALLALASAGPAAGQPDDEDERRLSLPGSGRSVPLHLVEDDVFVLADADWCENLLALSGEPGADGEPVAAEPAAIARCADFMARLRRERVVLLPLSLAGQLVALPDELLPTPEPPRPATDAPMTASGSGEASSQPFELRGGSYRTRVATSAACPFLAAFLTRIDTGVAVADVEPPGGEVADVAPGTYRWEVLAPSCDWTITLSPP